MRAIPSSSNRLLVNLATVILIVVALYFGKPVLMPLALATLFAFLLSPVVDMLARVGMRQPIAILLLVILMFSLLSAMAWGFGRQFRALADELPNYRQNIQEKVADLRSAGSGSTLRRIRQTWREIKGELKKPAPATAANNTGPSATTNAAPAEAEPVPVVVRGQEQPTIGSLTALGPLAEILATIFLVFVLLIFMLLRRRELRNRLILLFGYSRVPTTTRALDEAAERISRYLLMQTLVNSSYGTAVGVSLYFIGLPYALMWGFLAGLLRFIPYVGTWIGAALPIALSLAVFPGWLHPLLILGIIAVLEIINNSLMEPLLYGHTVGVSEVALLLAVAFWTWIWGPIGLVLATPLTVCLVVFGKHVPALSFLPMLLGDDTIMAPPLEFYQRLLAMDDVEAGQIVRAYSEKHELIKVFDELFLPALVSAKRDALNNKLSPDDVDFIAATTGQLITRTAEAAKAARGQETPENNGEIREVLAVPIEDTLDELAMSLLSHVLPASLRMRMLSADALSGEVLQQIQQVRPRIVCLGALSPGGFAESRYLAKRIQRDFPGVPIVIARWGLQNPRRVREIVHAARVSAVTTDLNATRNHLTQLAQLALETVQPQREEIESELVHN